MKNIYRIAITLGITAAVVVILLVVGNHSSEDRLRTACTGLEINILDSTSRSFVTKEDSVNLKKIESAIEGRSAVGTTQAYITLDGILHIDVTQRSPMVLFKTKTGGFYADENGFLFDMNDDYSEEVPVIEGDIPINVEAVRKGEPGTEKEKEWLSGILDLVRYIRHDKFWGETIAKIHVDNEENIIMTPREGKEKFIFGKPDGLKEKFSAIETYYRYIEPTKEKGYYASVDVRYEDQIICREK